jgi:hypothetical protein
MHGSPCCILLKHLLVKEEVWSLGDAQQLDDPSDADITRSRSNEDARITEVT